MYPGIPEICPFSNRAHVKSMVADTNDTLKTIPAFSYSPINFRRRTGRNPNAFLFPHLSFLSLSLSRNFIFHTVTGSFCVAQWVASRANSTRLLKAAIFCELSFPLPLFRERVSKRRKRNIPHFAIPIKRQQPEKKKRKIKGKHIVPNNGHPPKEVEHIHRLPGQCCFHSKFYLPSLASVATSKNKADRIFPPPKADGTHKSRIGTQRKRYRDLRVQRSKEATTTKKALVLSTHALLPIVVSALSLRLPRKKQKKNIFIRLRSLASATHYPYRYDPPKKAHPKKGKKKAQRG